VPIKIPKDWDGESYDCFRLAWPSSHEWRNTLYTVLYELTRGRTWDEKTGSVRGAQKDAWNVWGENIPFALCDSSGDFDDAGGTDSNQPGSGGFVFGSDNADCGECSDMVTCPIPALRWQDGKLQVYHCCEWQDVPSDGKALQSDTSELDTGLLPQDENVSQSCMNAHAALYVLEYTIAEAESVLGAYSLEAAPGEFRKRVWFCDRHDWIVYGYLAAVLVQVVLESYVPFTTALSDYQRSLLRCKLADVLGDDSIIGNEEHSAAGGVISGTLPGSQEIVARLTWSMLEADGVTRGFPIYSPTGSEDCTCPGDLGDQETEPTAAGWYLGAAYSFDVSGPALDPGRYNAWCRGYDNVEHDVYGVVIESHQRTGWNSTTFNQLEDNDATLEGQGPSDIPAPGADWLVHDTSDVGAGERLFVGADAVGDEVYGGAYRSGAEYLATYPGNTGGTVGTPVFASGSSFYIGGRFGAVATGGTASFTVRLIHNANSASHQ